MIIRTGVLCVPDWDEKAIDQIRLLMRIHLPESIVTDEKSVQNQRNWIEEILRRWADEDELSLILTIGGTYPAAGPSPNEIVPEATLAVIERRLPGLSEAMRAYAQEDTKLALLDRGVAGIRSHSVIINLPAGAAAAHLFFEGVIDLIPAILAHLEDKPDAPQIEHDLEIVNVEGMSNPEEEIDQVSSAIESDQPSRPLSAQAKPTIPDSSTAPVVPDDSGTNTKTGLSSGKKELNPAEFAEFLRKNRR